MKKTYITPATLCEVIVNGNESFLAGSNGVGEVQANGFDKNDKTPQIVDTDEEGYKDNFVRGWGGDYEY